MSDDNSNKKPKKGKSKSKKLSATNNVISILSDLSTLISKKKGGKSG